MEAAAQTQEKETGLSTSASCSSGHRALVHQRDKSLTHLVPKETSPLQAPLLMKPSPGNAVSPPGLKEPNAMQAEDRQESREADATHGSLHGTRQAVGRCAGAQVSHGEKDLAERGASSRSSRACSASSSSPFSRMGKTVSPNGRARFPAIHLDLPHRHSADTFPAHAVHLQFGAHLTFLRHQTSQDSWVGKTHPPSASSV